MTIKSDQKRLAELQDRGNVLELISTMATMADIVASSTFQMSRREDFRVEDLKSLQITNC